LRNDVFAGYTDHGFLYSTDYAYVYDATVNHVTGFRCAG
jgi:hypothetical protein